MTTPTTSARAFLEAVILEPDEEAHRLVFADWLEEHNDPRGEFIRLQCELELLDADDPRRPALAERERELRHSHDREWAGRLARLVGSFAFRRGFVERVGLDGKTLLAHAATIFRLAPVRELELTATPEELARLADCADLRRLAALELTYLGADGSTLADFLDSPHLAGLTFLKLRGDGAPAPAAVARSRQLKRLTELDLSSCAFGQEGIHTLGEAHSLPALARLRLAWTNLNDESARALAAAPLLGSLAVLDLRYNEVGADGAEALANSPSAGRLTALALGYNRIGDRGLAALAASPALPALARLYLSRNGLEGHAVKLLANSPLRSGLTHLDLDYNNVSSESLTALAASPYLEDVETLFLRCGPGLTDAVRRSLLRRFGEQVCRF
jgi:uncharacterized protein (TIGR02996 family)